MSENGSDHDDWFERAEARIRAMGAQGLEHPSSKPILAATFFGFIIGMTMGGGLGLIGAFIGALLMLAHEMKQDEDR